jgi:hypothetical protein
VIRVGATIGAGYLFVRIAFDSVRTSPSDDARRLVGYALNWINHLRFQPRLATCVLTVADFDNMPPFLSHWAPPILFFCTLIVGKPNDARQ